MGTESESKSGGGQRPSGGGSRSDDRSRADKSKASSSGRETNSGSARGKPSSRDDRGGQRSDSSRKPSSGGSRDDRDKERSRSEQDRRSTSDRDRKSQSERDRKSQPGGSSRSQSDRRRSPSDRDRRPQSERDSGRSREGSRASESHRDGRRDIQPHRGRPEDQQNIRPCRVFDSRPSPPRREGPGSDRRGDSRDGRPSSRERRSRDGGSRRRSRSPTRRDRPDERRRLDRPHSSGRSPRPSRRRGNEGCSDVSSSDLSFEEDQFSTVSSEEFHMIFDDGSPRQAMKRRRSPSRRHGNEGYSEISSGDLSLTEDQFSTISSGEFHVIFGDDSPHQEMKKQRVSPLAPHLLQDARAILELAQRAKYDRSPSPHHHGDRRYSDSLQVLDHILDDRGRHRSNSFERERERERYHSRGPRERSLSPREMLEPIDHTRFASPTRNPDFYSPPHVTQYEELSPVARVHLISEHEKVATEREKLELQLEKERLRRERMELEIMRAEMERARVQQPKDLREHEPDPYTPRSPVYRDEERRPGPDPSWRDSPGRRYPLEGDRDRAPPREEYYRDQRSHSLERPRDQRSHSLEGPRREEPQQYEPRDDERRREASYGREHSYPVGPDRDRMAASHPPYEMRPPASPPPPAARDRRDYPPDHHPPSSQAYPNRPESWPRGENERHVPPRRELSPERDDFYDPSKSPLYAGTSESPPYPSRSDSSARYPTDMSPAKPPPDPYGPPPTRTSPFGSTNPNVGHDNSSMFKPPGPAKPPLKGILKKSKPEAAGSADGLVASGAYSSPLGSQPSTSGSTIEGSADLYNTLFEKLMTQKPLPSGPVEMPGPPGSATESDPYISVSQSQPDPYTGRTDDPYRAPQDPYTRDQGRPDPYTTLDPSQQTYPPTSDYRSQTDHGNRPLYQEGAGAMANQKTYSGEESAVSASQLTDAGRELFQSAKQAESADFKYARRDEYKSTHSSDRKSTDRRESRDTGRDGLRKLDMGSPVSDAASLSPISDDDRRYSSHSYGSRRGHAEFSDINSSEDSPEHPRSSPRRSGLDGSRHRRSRSPGRRLSSRDRRSRSPDSPRRRRSISPRRRSLSPRRRSISPPRRRSPDRRRHSPPRRRSPSPRRIRRSPSPKARKGSSSLDQKDRSSVKPKDKSKSSANSTKLIKPNNRELEETGPIIFYNGMMCPVKNCKSRDFFDAKPHFDLHWKDVHMPEKECIICSLCEKPPRKSQLRFFTMLELEDHFQRWHPMVHLQALDQTVLEKMIPKSTAMNPDYIPPGPRTYQLGPPMPGFGMPPPMGPLGVPPPMGPMMRMPPPGWMPPMGPPPGPMMGPPGPLGPGFPFPPFRGPPPHIAPNFPPPQQPPVTKDSGSITSESKPVEKAPEAKKETKSAVKRTAESSSEQPPAKKSNDDAGYNKKGNLLVVCTNNSSAKKKSPFPSWETACFKKENVCPMKGCDSGVKYSNQAHFLHHWKTSHLNYEYGPCGLCLHTKEDIAILSLSSMQFFKNHFKTEHPSNYPSLGLQRPSSFILIKSNVEQFDTSSFVEKMTLEKVKSKPAVSPKKINVNDVNMCEKMKAMTSHVAGKERRKMNQSETQETEGSKESKETETQEVKASKDSEDTEKMKSQSIKEEEGSEKDSGNIQTDAGKKTSGEAQKEETSESMSEEETCDQSDGEKSADKKESRRHSARLSSKNGKDTAKKSKSVDGPKGVKKDEMDDKSSESEDGPKGVKKDEMDDKGAAAKGRGKRGRSQIDKSLEQETKAPRMTRSAAKSCATKAQLAKDNKEVMKEKTVPGKDSLKEDGGRKTKLENDDLEDISSEEEDKKSDDEVVGKPGVSEGEASEVKNEDKKLNEGQPGLDESKNGNHAGVSEKQGSDSKKYFSFQTFSKCPVLDCPFTFNRNAITAADYLFHWQLTHCRAVQRYVCIACETEAKQGNSRIDPVRKLPYTLAHHLRHCHKAKPVTNFDSIPKSSYRVDWVYNAAYIDPGDLWYDKAEHPPCEDLDVAYPDGLYECPYEMERDHKCIIEGCSMAKEGSSLPDPQRHWNKVHAAERLQYFCLLCGVREKYMIEPKVKWFYLSVITSHFKEYHAPLQPTITTHNYDLTFVMADWLPNLPLHLSPQVVLLHKSPALPEIKSAQDVGEAYRSSSRCPVMQCRLSGQMNVSCFLKHWHMRHEPLLTLRYMCRRCKQQRLSFHCKELWEMRQHIAMVHQPGAITASSWVFEDPENPPSEQVIKMQITNSAYIPPGPYQRPEEHQLYNRDSIDEVNMLRKVSPDAVCPVDGCSFGLLVDQQTLEKHWGHVHCPFVLSYECCECRMVIPNDQAEPYDRNTIQQHYIQKHMYHKILYQAPNNPPSTTVTLSYELQPDFIDPGSYWVEGLPCTSEAAKSTLAPKNSIVFDTSEVNAMKGEGKESRKGEEKENGTTLKLTIPKTSSNHHSVQVKFQEGMSCPVELCGAGQTFPNIQDFELHWFSHHVRPRGFRCLLCTGAEAKMVYAAVTLRIHMRNEHPSMRAITESSPIPSQFIEQQSMPAFNFVHPGNHVYETATEEESMMLEILSNLCLRYSPEGIEPQVYNKLVTNLLNQLPECTPKQPEKRIDISEKNLKCSASACVDRGPFPSKRDYSRHWDFRHKPFVVRNYCCPCDLWMVGAWATYRHFAVTKHWSPRFKEHLQVEMIPNRFYVPPDNSDSIPRLQSDEFVKPYMKAPDSTATASGEQKKEEKSKITFKPGMSCPVSGCRMKRIRTRAHLDMHLLENHVTDAFICALCGFAQDSGQKVLPELKRHYKKNHSCVDLTASLVQGALGSLFFVNPCEYKQLSFTFAFTGGFELDCLPDVSLNPKNLATPKDPSQPCLPRACICVQWVPDMLCPVPSCFSVRRFTKKEHFDRHWRLAHTPTRDMYCCETCGSDQSERPRAMFSYKSDFEKHHEEVHPGSEVDMEVTQAPSLFYINPGRFQYIFNTLKYFEGVGQPELM